MQTVQLMLIGIEMVFFMLLLGAVGLSVGTLLRIKEAKYEKRQVPKKTLEAHIKYLGWAGKVSVIYLVVLVAEIVILAIEGQFQLGSFTIAYTAFICLMLKFYVGRSKKNTRQLLIEQSTSKKRQSRKRR